MLTLGYIFGKLVLTALAFALPLIAGAALVAMITPVSDADDQREVGASGALHGSRP